MKQIAVILFLAGALAAGAAAQADKTPKAAPKAERKPAPKARPQALVPPPDAERISEGIWRARDAQGRTWIYKKTPFGMVRYEDEGAAGQPAAKLTPLRVREAGAGGVVFERQTPFGVSTWTRKPEELGEEERQAFEDWRKRVGK